MIILDENKDDKISFDEILEYLADPETKIKAAFKALEREGNKLPIDELDDFLKAIGRTPTTTYMKELTAALDPEHTGEVDFEQLKREKQRSTFDLHLHSSLTQTRCCRQGG